MLINNQIYRRLGVVAEILFPEKMPNSNFIKLQMGLKMSS